MLERRKQNFSKAEGKGDNFINNFCILILFHNSRYSEANEQLEKALKCMRGNKYVDYKQLGLKFQLYECEVC